MAIIYTCGEALVRCEHMARGAGQVQFWTPDVTGLYLAQQHLHLSLMQHAVQPMVVSVLAKLLLWSEALALMEQVVELVHFNSSYQRLCAKYEAVGASMQLWAFLKHLVKFAAAHAGKVEGG